MSYLGSWKIDDNLTFPVNTHNASTGAATDADAVPSYRVYEDETGTAILTGSMAKLDDANTVGFYSEQIALSAANGFEKGKCYTIYISAAVSSVTGTMNHTFQMEAEVDSNTVSPGVTLAAGAITNASLAGNMETVFETDFATNYGNNRWQTLLADNANHGGSSFVLTGDRLTFTSTSGNCASFTGEGIGAGLVATGGATGAGLRGVGGGTTGNGFRAESTGSSAVYIEPGNNQKGLYVVGTGSGDAVTFQGGATGNGFSVTGGGTSGDAVTLSVTSGNAINYGGTEFRSAVQSECEDALNVGLTEDQVPTTGSASVAQLLYTIFTFLLSMRFVGTTGTGSKRDAVSPQDVFTVDLDNASDPTELSNYTKL